MPFNPIITLKVCIILPTLKMREMKFKEDRQYPKMWQVVMLDFIHRSVIHIKHCLLLCLLLRLTQLLQKVIEGIK